MPADLPDAGEVQAVLDGIPEAFERAQAGARQAAAGEVVALDELAKSETSSTPPSD